MKKNLSWAVVTPALPNAASTRLIHVWMFFLSKFGSSTFLMWLFDEDVVGAAAVAWAPASGFGALIEAAISCAAAFAEAVAILIMSSTERDMLSLELDAEASSNCSSSGLGGSMGGNSNVP